MKNYLFVSCPNGGWSLCLWLFALLSAGTLFAGNQSPVITSGQHFIIDVTEVSDHVALGTVEATDDADDIAEFQILAGDPQGYFAIDEGGTLTIVNHHLTVATYRLTVRATDGSGQSDEEIVVVEVTQLSSNQSPHIIGHTFNVLASNAVDGLEIATITATDPDREPEDAPLEYRIHHTEKNGGDKVPGDEQTVFALGVHTGKLTFADASSARANDSYRLHVHVRDEDGGTAVTYFTVNIGSPRGPYFTAQHFTVTEGSPAGTFVGTVVATDDGRQNRYRIADGTFLKVGNPPDSDSDEDSAYDAATVFRIDEATGELTVNAPKYLLSTLGPIQLAVEVTNDQQLTSSASVTVDVEDMEVLIEEAHSLSWTRVASHPVGHSEGTGGAAGNKLYAFGGFGARFAPKEDVHVYDPATDLWRQLADAPPMADDSGAGGATHMGWTTDGTDIYIAAGNAANIAGDRQQFGSTRVYRYNVASDTYTELEPLPVDRSAGELEYVDHKLYYVAGSNRARSEDQGDLFILDLDNPALGWQIGSRMPNPRNHLGSAVLNGKIYILGGQKEHDGELIPQDDVHAYDPTTDTWTHVTDMPKAFNHIHSSVFAYGEYIYSIGGQIDHGTGGHDDVYAYHPEDDRWIRFTTLPGNRYSAVADAIDGRLYVSGGNNSRITYAATLPDEFIPRTTVETVTEVALEAECGIVGSDWVRFESASASGGAYVSAPGLTSGGTPTDHPKNYIRFAIDRMKAGQYHLFARSNAPNFSSDSYWVRINDGPWIRWWRGITTYNSGFQWRAFVGNTFPLAEGTNTIDFAYREGKTQLDKILVSQSADLPTDMGTPTTSCMDYAMTFEAECAEVGSGFTTLSHPAAANGEVVTWNGGYSNAHPPEDVPANRVRFSFEVPADDGYAIYARSRGDGSSFNSYWVRINGGPWNLWFYRTTDPSGLVWNRVAASRLSAGTNTVEFAYREPYTHLDQLHVNTTGLQPSGRIGPGTNCEAGPGEPTASTFWLEAECAEVGGSFVVGSHNTASRERVALPTEYSTAGPPADVPANRIRFRVMDPTPGTYSLFARVRADATTFDSYWVRVNQGAWIKWFWRNEVSGGLAWNEVNTPEPFRLVAGTNTIDFAYREPNVYLDKIHLNRTATAPAGLGEQATNCAGARDATVRPDGYPPELPPGAGEEDVFRAYPNPVVERVHFSLATKFRGEARVGLFNLQGQLVRDLPFRLDGETTGGSLSVAGLPPGTYMLQTVYGERVLQRLIVVQP